MTYSRKEDRTEVKFSQFFALVKQAAQYETVMNAVNCDVPHRFIRETMTGKKEEVPEIPEKKEAVLGVVKVDFDAEEFRKTLQEATAEIKAKFGPEEDEAEQEQAATGNRSRRKLPQNSILDSTQKKPHWQQQKKPHWQRQKKPPAEGRKENETW